MPSNESPTVSVSRCGHRRLGSRRPHTVVWVRGEHDIATRAHLSATIAQAARLDDADLVVDLSGVTFMDASTIGALVAARNRLRAPARSLSVRAPSPPARRLLDLCGLAQLIDEHPVSAQRLVAAALRSWVDVPAGVPAPSVAPTASPRTPAPVRARRRAESTEPAQQPRAPS